MGGIVIDFMVDDLIQTDVSYQLVISNANNRNLHRDKKLKHTIQVIVEEFFNKITLSADFPPYLESR